MEGEKGEISLLLKDIKRMSEEVLHDLKEVDTKLASIEEKISNDATTVMDVIKEIKDVRKTIGNMEAEETEEIEAEEITENLINKLNEMIEKCIR